MTKAILSALLLLLAFSALLGASETTAVLDAVLVDIDGVGSPRRVREVLGLRRGDLLDPPTIAAALERLEADGRYAEVDAVLRPSRKGRSDLLVRLAVDPGYRPETDAPIRVDRIEITGNWKTRRGVILSEFLFDEGDTVEPALIEESVQRVFNREYFFDIDWGLYDEGAETVMELRIREKWTLFPVIFVRGDDELTQFSLGAIDTNLGGMGFLVLGNYLGSIYRDGGYENNVNVLYVHERIAGTPLSAVVSTGYVIEQNHVRNADGVRIQDYDQANAYFNSRFGYNWTPEIRTSLVFEYEYDRYSGDYDYDLGTTALGGQLERDALNIADVRTTGFQSRAEALAVIPGNSDPTFLRSSVRADGYALFARDILHLSSRIRLDYSSAEELIYRTTREEFLRGGSSREYFTPLLLGANLELMAAPIRENWLFLELGAFADVSWGDDGGLMYRWGPGMRISFPPIAALAIAVDYARTERGDGELYFGMMRFLSTR